MGQNLGQFQNNAQLANQFGQLGMAGEGQGFGQQLQALQQNQQGAQGRMAQMLQLFGQTGSQFNQSQQIGLGNLGAQNDISALGLQGLLGTLNAESQRVLGTQGHAQAIADLSKTSGGLLGGLF